MNFDLFSPKFKSNPFPTFAQMRANAPIYPHAAPSGDTIWYITRYQDVLAVLKDTERFVKDIRNVKPQEKSGTAPGIHQAINQNMLFADAPDHTRLRALVNLAFTPRRVSQMAPRIQAVADELLDKVQAQGRMDLIADYALPLPIIVIADMLGIPPEERDDVFDWSQAIIAPGRHGLTFRARRRKVRAFVEYLRGLFADRQQQPRDDLTTALVQAEQEGDKLTEAELSSMVALLFVTGHETTVNLIGNGMLALLRHPDQLALLKSNPALIDSAIEELLRYDGPVETSTTRWAREDVELHGQQIKRGDIVRVVLTSANRDPACCPHADQLDVTRTEQHHLAFGHGIHYCLGAPLARLEGRIAVETLLRRMPTLRLAVPVDELEWHSGVLFRGLEALPVAWDL